MGKEKVEYFIRKLGIRKIRGVLKENVKCPMESCFYKALVYDMTTTNALYAERGVCSSCNIGLGKCNLLHKVVR